jgi:DNA-binding transcriptional LysR family regulator
MLQNLDEMAVFVALVEARGFRAAGERLGVSGSAVSQTLRRLEARLGTALVNRTTRSVHLTDAGERLYAALRPALDQVQAAVEAVGAMAREPRGTLRLSVSGSAESFLSGPAPGEFLLSYPDIVLELTVSNVPADIVAEGFDAGIRLGEAIDQDMHVVALSGEQRMIVVGAPSYFATHSMPEHPRDLAQHACLNFRPGPDAPPYRWEFTEPESGREFTVLPTARVLTNDVALIHRLARAGVGLTIAREERIQPFLKQGDLVTVLEAYSAPFPGLYLYYPQRRQASPALRALLDHLSQKGNGEIPSSHWLERKKL